MALSVDEITQAIRWKLGLDKSSDSKKMEDIWQQFADGNGFRDTARTVCRFIAEDMFERSLRHRLGVSDQYGTSKRDEEYLDSLLDAFVSWIQTDGVYRSPKLSGAIDRAIKYRGVKPRPDMHGYAVAHPKVVQSGTGRSPETKLQGIGDADSRTNAAGPTKQQHLSPRPRGDDVAGPDVKPASPEAHVPGPTVSSLTIPAADRNTSVSSKWKNLPPAEEPDPHPEFDERSGKSPEGYAIIGARARGKKHKHEGTHCDDWLDFAVGGAWTVMAVCDGGGSYKFSRVGARVASEKAVQVLKERLASHQIAHRESWSNASFEEADVTYVKEALVDSLAAAWQAVKVAAVERAESEAHRKILGRPLTVKDLYATLLVAVHTTVKGADDERSLVLSCSVGDGMVAVIDKDAGTRLLMTPDSGEHSGEVRFLDDREIEPGKLHGKLRCFFGSLRALLLMTDGVADDYFPNDPGMSALYGDLVLNRILSVNASDDEIASALAPTKWTTLDDVEPARFQAQLETPTSAAERAVFLRSLTAFADALGLPLQEVVKSIPLLAAGCRGEPMCGEKTPEGRLKVWLDSYHVRGSFDDRTLLILQR